MARRADHTREELKEMILETGIKIITEEGFHALGARRIAREIGYTVGTLYNIFEDYNDIVIHINSRTIDKLNEFVKANYKESKSPIKSISNLIHVYLDFVEDNLSLWKTLYDYNQGEIITLPKWYTSKIDILFTLIEVPVYAIVGDKKTSIKAARVLWAGVHGICILNLTGKMVLIDQEPVRDMADSLVKHYLDGLKKK